MPRFYRSKPVFVTREGYPYRSHWVTPMVLLGCLLTAIVVCCGAFALVKLGLA